MRDLTYISPNVPLAVSHFVHGVWQRQQLFIDALAPLFDRIHCIFWRGLWPDNDLSDDEIRAKASAAFGKDVRVTLLQPARRSPDPSYVDYYLKSLLLGPESCVYRRVIGDSEVTQLGACLNDATGVVFAHRLEAMAPVSRLRRRWPVTIWDADDLECMKFFRGMKYVDHSLGKPLMYLQGLGLFWQERKASRAAALGFVCSEIDKQRACSYFGGRFETAANGVRVLDSPLPSSRDVPTLLFVGFFGYEPNRDAVNWFLSEVWPVVLSDVPEARLLVAGARPDLLQCEGNPPPSVHLLGFVPDLEPVYLEADVVICPIRNGSGTRIKLLEAAAHGRPVVSTTLGAEGIAFEDGESALLVDEPIAFARSCVALLKDRQRAIDMGHRSWQLIKDRYGRGNVIEGIRERVVQTFRETKVQHKGGR